MCFTFTWGAEMAIGTYGAQDASPWASPWRRGPVERMWQIRPTWIVATVLAFIIWWPLGLSLLGFLIGSGRMGCRGSRFRAAEPGWGSGAGPWAAWRNFCGGDSDRAAPTSGNAAFDEYRAETLRRLEEEQKEFTAFLERLRVAKDKAEFDAFMAERRQRAQRPPEEPSAA